MAVLTVTTPGGEDARIQAAFGKYLGLAGGASASGAQIKQAVMDWMKSVVRQQETYTATASAAAGVVDVSPT